MAAEYLVRFDDICPTMPWKIWGQIEAALDQYKVKPLLAVIPKNTDVTFFKDPPHEQFWAQVRAWQAKGWGIGVHGFNHEYVTREFGILGISAKSEFAGVEREVQREKLRKAVTVFREEGVTPRVFVAPSHSFDLTTLSCLSEVGLYALSDGFALWSYSDSDGRVWIPQQLWNFRWMPYGEWTVCLHATEWTERDVASFERTLSLFSSQCRSVDDFLARGTGRKDSVLNRAFSWGWKRVRQARSCLPREPNRTL